MDKSDGRAMTASREGVPMSLIRPSGTNPREDMGDVRALARSIEATGGQPVNPIVVVPDGGTYRIVDGERRFRALRVLGADRADCVVVGGYDEADELVAMMATDDKKPLTDEERARGTQRVLRLDVPERRAAGALGATAETVRRVRRVMREAPEQATLDVMIAASDESFSAEERRRVIAMPDGAAAAREADLIRREHAAAEAKALIREAAGGGVTFDDGVAPTWDPEGSGLVYLGIASASNDVAKTLAKAPDGASIVAYPKRSGRPGYVLFAVDPDASERRREEAEAERAADRLTEDWRESVSRMAAWAAASVAAGPRGGALRPWPKGDDPFLGRELMPYQTDLIGEAAAKSVASVAPSGYEIVDAVTLAAAPRLFFMGASLSVSAARKYVEAYDWCSARGWRPCEADEAARAAIEGALKDAEGGRDD